MLNDWLSKVELWIENNILTSECKGAVELRNTLLIKVQISDVALDAWPHGFLSHILTTDLHGGVWLITEENVQIFPDKYRPVITVSERMGNTVALLSNLKCLSDSGQGYAIYAQGADRDGFNEIEKRDHFHLIALNSALP